MEDDCSFGSTGTDRHGQCGLRVERCLMVVMLERGRGRMCREDGWWLGMEKLKAWEEGLSSGLREEGGFVGGVWLFRGRRRESVEVFSDEMWASGQTGFGLNEEGAGVDQGDFGFVWRLITAIHGSLSLSLSSP